MQEDRQEMTHKQRKLFSRDRDKSGSSKHIQNKKIRDVSQHKLNINSSPKQKYIFMGIKNELSNLKQEVSRLSQSRYHHIDTNYSPKFQSPTKRAQKKNINDYYFQYNGSTQKSDLISAFSTSQRDKPERSPCQKKNLEPTHDVELLLTHLRDVQLQNKDLSLQNQELRVQIGEVSENIKIEYEKKIKMLENQRQRKGLSLQRQNDKTVTIKLRNKEQQNQLKRLEEELSATSNQLQQVKKKCELRVQDSDKKTQILQQQLLKSAQQHNEDIKQLEHYKKVVRSIQLENISLKQKIKSLQENISEEKIAYRKCILQLTNQESENQELRIVNQQLQRSNDSLQKQCQQSVQAAKEIQTKIEDLVSSNQLIKQKQESNQKLSERVEELQGLVNMQERSIQNYQSDLYYLQQQAQKHFGIKQENQRLLLLVNKLNQECLSINLQFLNQRFS